MPNKDLTDVIDVPILENGGRNYTAWRRALTAYISSRSTFDICATSDPPKPLPGAPNWKNKERHVVWETEQQQMLGVFEAKISATIRSDFDHYGATTIREAFEWAHFKYRPRGTRGYRETLDRLRKLTLATCSSIADFANKIQVIQEELAEMDPEYAELQVPQLVDHFLFGLGAEYNTFVSGFVQDHLILPERDDSNIITRHAVTLDQAKRAAELEESLINQRKEQDKDKGEIRFESQAALVAHVSQNPALFKPKSNKRPYGGSSKGGNLAKKTNIKPLHTA